MAGLKPLYKNKVGMFRNVAWHTGVAWSRDGGWYNSNDEGKRVRKFSYNIFYPGNFGRPNKYTAAAVHSLVIGNLKLHFGYLVFVK